MVDECWIQCFTSQEDIHKAGQGRAPLKAGQGRVPQAAGLNHLILELRRLQEQVELQTLGARQTGMSVCDGTSWQAEPQTLRARQRGMGVCDSWPVEQQRHGLCLWRWSPGVAGMQV